MQRPSPALVVAVVAVVIAGTGSAAAARYVITSPSQIAPKVRAELQGKKGPRGVAGRPGAAGPQGAPGAAGAQGGIGQTGPQGATGATGPAGADAVYARTRFDYNSGGADTNSEDFVELVALGTFVKQRSTSAITVQLNTIGSQTKFEATCYLQARVDGETDRPGFSFTGTEAIVITDNGEFAPAFTEAVFTGLAAGTHSVSIWGATSDPASSCIEDAGGFPRSAFVIESP